VVRTKLGGCPWVLPNIGRVSISIRRPNRIVHLTKTVKKERNVRKYWNIFGLLLVMTLATTQSSSAIPNTITFNFSGTCTDCSGTATATLVLVGSYTIGTPITNSNLVSFTYNGTNLTNPFTYTPSGAIFTPTGSMTTIPGPNAFRVETNGGEIFSSSVNGNWSVSTTDVGTAGTWSLAGGIAATPAPPAGILLVAGLMCLTAFFAWRRRRQTTLTVRG